MSKFHRSLLHQITAEDEGSREAKKETKHRGKPKEEERGERRVSLGEASAADEEEPSPDREQQVPDNSSPSPARSEHSLGDSGQEDTGEDRLGRDPAITPSSDSQLHAHGRKRESGEEDKVAPSSPVVDKEERRKAASAKRTNEETLSSAKERYLARKRAKLSVPVISTDD